jgi:ribosomal protein L37AE/L43A
MKWQLRGCPACGGDLYEETDRMAEGSLACFMCGRRWEGKATPQAPAVAQAAFRETGPGDEHDNANAPLAIG